MIHSELCRKDGDEARNLRMAPVALFILSVLAHLVVLHSAEYSKEEPAKHCPAPSCRSIGVPISFPFRSTEDPHECGLFRVNCSVPGGPKVQLKEGGYWHEFKGSLASAWIFFADGDLADRLRKGHCNDGVFNDLSLPRASPIPEVTLSIHNLTLFKCNTALNNNSYPQLIYGCENAYHNYIASSDGSLPSPPPPGCTTIQVPMRPFQSIMLTSLTAEFSIEVFVPDCYPCFERKGECLFDEGKLNCTIREKGDEQLKLKLGLGKIDIFAFKYLIDMDAHLGQVIEPKDGNQSFPNTSGLIF